MIGTISTGCLKNGRAGKVDAPIDATKGALQYCGIANRPFNKVDLTRFEKQSTVCQIVEDADAVPGRHQGQGKATADKSATAGYQESRQLMSRSIYK